MMVDQKMIVKIKWARVKGGQRSDGSELKTFLNYFLSNDRKVFQASMFIAVIHLIHFFQSLPKKIKVMIV